MILRVYAIWNRSQRILYILLFIYVPQVILSFILTGIYNNPSTYLSVTTVQFINFAICDDSVSNITVVLASHLYAETLRLVLSIALLTLAIAQTLKQLVAMYRATKQWQPNQYLQQLVKDGILYFFVYVSYIIFNLLQDGPILNSTSIIFLGMVFYPTIALMMPRFIISIRELYDHDLHRHSHGIDTGFGVWSQPATCENAVISAIAFADINQGQGVGQVVEGDMEDLEVLCGNHILTHAVDT
ncbi:hypothetical protein OG21DRAFT_1181965 [Imleria badia]|nr:hypothetical protein OG21DRAFT_1181965 [Imleria badia]